ncbi:hypothetical protein Hanom_Chr01g00067681 [Helianthus anomalus]
MHVVVANEKVKDVAPHADSCKENALFKTLCTRPTECTVIPEGALVLTRMSQVWRNKNTCPSFVR